MHNIFIAFQQKVEETHLLVIVHGDCSTFTIGRLQSNDVGKDT